MPIDPVKIPQNVQIEDRVVGPLSLRQIIIMAVGGGFSYMVYALVQRTYGHVSIPLTAIIWIPALVAVAFALVNVNDLSLLRICFLLLERMEKPAQRTWAPRTGISITVRTSSFKTEEPKKAAAAPERVSAEKQIAELSSVLEKTGGAPLADDVPLAPAAMDIVAAPKPPVNPGAIRVDSPLPAPAATELSDLSVFRDIFPPTTSWQA